MEQRRVTELDFRKPEFRDAKVEDYEFRGDGALVRKDRWECAVNSIRNLVGIDSRSFEIVDVVDAVRKIVVEQEGWFHEMDEDELENGDVIDVQLKDGSILKNSIFNKTKKSINWSGQEFSENIYAWRLTTNENV